MGMVDIEGQRQKAWPMVRQHARRRGLCRGNTQEGMAGNAASHQKAWSIVRHHTSRHG